MKDIPDEMPGLVRIREKFLSMLPQRQMQIAVHALDAWEGETVDQVNDNLRAAQHVLHQIAGTAGSLGLIDLGIQAQQCETQIIEHLNGPNADLALCPECLALTLDQFVATCQHLLDTPR